MKTSNKTMLVAMVGAALTLAGQANAIQKHDPQFQDRPVFARSQSDPDLVHDVKNQPGSPKAKKDWLARNVKPSSADARDLAYEVRYQNGSPRMKQDPSFAIAPLK